MTDAAVATDVLQAGRGVVALWRDADRSQQMRELLYGEAFNVVENVAGMAFGRAGKDDYAGYVETSGLVPYSQATHLVCARATHLYSKPDIKSPAVMSLSFGSRLAVVGASENFFETADGKFVPSGHARVISSLSADPAAVAELFVGVPYLWGGNSCWGIDCSGLVQAALLACGVPSPADSKDQETAVGAILQLDEPMQRGDLLFWDGHVAMAVTCDQVIHATAHSMSVVCEPISDVAGRIAAAGGGPITSRRRP